MQMRCKSYVPYMYMASIWELYGFNGQFLQPTDMGLTVTPIYPL